MLREKLSLAVVLAVLIYSSVVEGIELSSRKSPACDYMGSQIYCYGGDTSATDDRSIDTNLYSLDINRFYGQPTNSISHEWKTITPSVAFDTEQRRIPSAIVLSDTKRLLVHGGSNPNLKKFINQTIVYDTTTNSWQSLLPYTEPNRGIRQIFQTALVNLPNNLVGFYGGTEQLSNTSVPQISASGVTMPLLDNNRSAVGFNVMQTYSPEATSWTSFSPQTNLPANYYPQAQTATLDPVSGKVYYFGGGFFTPDNTAFTVAPLNWAYTFNTKSGTWLNETFGGVVPGKRRHHTAHLLPNSRHVIIYGGTSDNDKPLVEYCFTLNLDDNTWTKQNNVNVPPELSGPRFDHSSVIVNTTLFVFFGIGSDGKLQPSFFSIDVSNVANIVYTATIGPPSNNNTSIPQTDSNSSVPQNTQSSALSKGAIGGIAAGAAVAALSILAGIVCFIRRKRNSDQKEAPYNQDEHTIEQIHVDWDKIDGHYREVLPVGITAPNSPQSANLEDINRNLSPSPGIASTLVNSPNISSVRPSIDITDKGYTVTKPDGA